MKYCWEYTDDYLEYRSSLGLDIRNPGYYIKDFSRYLRNTYPNEIIITKEMVFPWCIARSNEKSYSFKTRMSNLRQFTIFVYSLGVCEFILDTSFTPKAERYVPYIFTDQELSDLFNIAIRISIQDPKSYKKLVLSIIYRLIFYCGLRPNEGREIMISDINLNNQTIFIRKNKTHKERIIPISDDISEMIKDYMRKASLFEMNSPYLFSSPKFDCYKSTWLRTEFLKLWEEVKDPSNTARVRVYDLRHRFATTLMMKFIDEGKDLNNILPYMSSYMGHSSFEETAYYIHLLPDRLKNSKAIDWEKMESIIPEVSQ